VDDLMQTCGADITVASPAATRTEAPTRLAFVDNVRSGMIVLVLGMHAAVTYSPFGSWFLREHPPLTQAEAMFFLTFQAFLQGFFMALLFFVAGCFTPDAYDRKGAVRFLADRTYRLGLPALLFALIIGPVMRYFLIGSWDTARSFPIAMAAYIASGQVLSGTGPLWFCVALLIFSVGYTLWRLAQPRAFAIRDLTTRHVVFALLAMAVGTFLTKTVIPGGKPSSTCNWPTSRPMSSCLRLALSQAGVAGSHTCRTAFCCGFRCGVSVPPSCAGGRCSPLVERCQAIPPPTTSVGPGRMLRPPSGLR
jgi:hypothetical protein